MVMDCRHIVKRWRFNKFVLFLLFFLCFSACGIFGADKVEINTASLFCGIKAKNYFFYDVFIWYVVL